MEELNGDQRRETINTAQRYAAFVAAEGRARGYRGSLSWHTIDGQTYLVRSYYDGSGRRRQRIEGRRDGNTEALRHDWIAGREEAREMLADIRAVLERQSDVNRALRLGRVPIIGARIIRALDRAGLLGRGLRIVGTNAIFAYEAVAGVMVDAACTTTEDIDLLLDARRSLRIVSSEDVKPDDLIDIVRSVDHSFARSQQPFRAVNRSGYLVDLIEPEHDPPWHSGRETVGPSSDRELTAVSLAGLVWHENAPPFEATVIDERGAPLRIVATDPRVFAAHKLWLSTRPDREPLRRRRDAQQARTVGVLVARYLRHLPYDAKELRMLPRAVFEAAAPLFDESRPRTRDL